MRPPLAAISMLLALTVGLPWSPWAASEDHPDTLESADAGLEPEKSFALPALQIMGFDLLWSRANRQFSGSSDYRVSWASVGRNLRGPWVVDNDPFSINQFAHPYPGAFYHGAGRVAGLSFREASALTFACSAFWEITGEQVPPSRNDQIASGIAGSFLGEPLFRMSHLLLSDRSGLPPERRGWLASAVSPSVGLNRWLFGSRFESAFSGNDPNCSSRFPIGATHAVEARFDTPVNDKVNGLQMDFKIE